MHGATIKITKIKKIKIVKIQMLNWLKGIDKVHSTVQCA
jgi:hypothetical protein